MVRDKWLPSSCCAASQVLKIDTLESVYSNDPKIITDSHDVAPFSALLYLQILKNGLCIVYLLLFKQYVWKISSRVNTARLR